MNKPSAIETQFFAAQPGGATIDQRDLGFGAEVAKKSRARFLNRDGSFNVSRTGYRPFASESLFHFCLNLSWPKFFALIGTFYVLMNLIFACLYYLCGPNALQGFTDLSPLGRFLDSFFFSVQTLATVGYGRLNPVSLSANFLATAELLVGLLMFALATGLFFARFSRPTAKIIYSKNAVIAPYRGKLAFELRIANERKNQLMYVQARVVMSRFELNNGMLQRKFYDLPLERREVMFFPLHWSIVHPIDEESPLFNVTANELKTSDAEFIILLNATDDTFSQVVHSWSSYKDDEIVWGAKFANILEEREDGSIGIDLRRIHDLVNA